MSAPIDVLAGLVQPDKLHAAIKRLRSFERTTPIRLAEAGQVYACSQPGNFIAFQLWTPDAEGAAFIPPPFLYRLRVQLTASGAREEELEFLLLPGEVLSLPFDSFRASLHLTAMEIPSKFFAAVGVQRVIPYVLHGWSLGDLKLPSSGAPSPVQEIGCAGWYTQTTLEGPFAPGTLTPLPAAVGSAAGQIIEHLRITNAVASPGAVTLEDAVAGTLETIPAGGSVPLNYPMDIGPLGILTGAAAGAYTYVTHYGVRY